MAHRWMTCVVLAAVLVAGPAGPAQAQAQAEARDITRFACPVDLIDAAFTDIDGNTHELAIRCLATYEITQGTSETEYSPSQFVRRGQMATFLFRLLAFQGLPMDVEDQGFTDIAGHPHEESINGIASIGVARGRTATRFGPDDLITRAEMATFLHRVIGLFGGVPAGADAFDDDDGSAHEPAIDAVAAAGIAQGVGDRRFEPNGAVTRAAMAAFITRLLDWGIEENVMVSFTGDLIGLAALTPSEVVGGGTAGVGGSIALETIGMDDVICYSLLVDGLADEPDAVVHVHKGEQGTTGGAVVLTVEGPFVADPDFPIADGRASRCVRADAALVDDLRGDPEAYYAEIHTDAAPDGAARGQLGRLEALVVAELEGSEVVPDPGDPDGFGYAEILTTTQPDDLCYYVGVSAVSEPTAAEVRRAPPGATGDVAVSFKTPVQTVADIHESAGCIGGLDPVVVRAIADSPQDFYVTVATSTRPGGAVRGQLEAASVS